jgi:hypothetical protein
MCNCNGYIHNKIQCTLNYVQILKNKLKSYCTIAKAKERNKKLQCVKVTMDCMIQNNDNGFGI